MLFYPYTYLIAIFSGYSNSWVTSIHNFEGFCWLPVLRLWNLKMVSFLASMVTTKVRCHSVPYLLYIWPVFISREADRIIFVHCSISGKVHFHPSSWVLGGLFQSEIFVLQFREIILNHFFSDFSCVHSFFLYRILVIQMLDFQDWLSKFLFSLFFF